MNVQVSASTRTGFTLLSPDVTGLTFTNSIDEQSAAANRVLLNGSGVAAGDYDNDGWPDVFFCGLNTPCQLYRNLGDWRFKDVTAESGIVCAGRNFRGAVFADINGDGALDVLVATTGQGVLCFQNDGRGKFTDVTRFAQTVSTTGSMTLALADVDGNGTLDLYVANNRTDDFRDRGQVKLHMVNGKMVVPPELQDRLVVVNGQVLEYGEPDQLYLNDGRGRFTPVSWTGGRFRDEDGGPLTQPPRDWGLSAMFRDINEDGFPDLYVCNDFWTPDRVWLNDGKGRFRLAARLALRNMSASSMGVDFADIDRDGHDDFLVVDMLSRDPRLRKRQKPAQAPMASPPGTIDDRPQFMRNTLFLSRGDGTFSEIANFAGVAASEWSWSPVFLDVDLDGYEDLLITTGHARDVQDLDALSQIRARQHSWEGFTNEAERQKAFTKELMEHMRLYPPLDTPVVAFRNRGDLHFDDVTAAWGTGQPGVHHAIALVDFDRDGDLDFVVNNLGTAAGVYRNESPAPRVAVKLKGLSPNTQGIGAKVTLRGGAVPMQSQEIICGGRYLAGSEPMLVFAAGNAERRASGMTLEVKWRSGARSLITNVIANRLYEAAEVGAQPPSLAPRASRLAPLFTDASPLLKHRHHEEPFDDFSRQPLLPFRLSQAGPAAAWFDLDGDGTEELFIGGGRGGVLAGYRVNSRGDGFEPMASPALPPLPDDTTGLVGWCDASGRRALLAGMAACENDSAPSIVRFELAGGRQAGEKGGKGAGENSPSLPFSLSPPLSFPGAREESRPAAAGRGSTALAMADFDGDGDLDLFVAGAVVPARYPEAAPSRIYRGAGKQLELDAENTRQLTEVGLVNGAVWSDLDGDGFAELILACEWGPVRVFRNVQGKLQPSDPIVEDGRTGGAESQQAGKPAGQNSPPPAFRPAGLQLFPPRSLSRLTGWWRGVTTGDIDGDGRLDIVVANWGVNSPYQASGQLPLKVFFGDFAERGGMDLIESEYDPVLRAAVPLRMFDALAVSMPFLRERFSTHKTFSETTVAELLGPRVARARQLEVNTLECMVFFNRGDGSEREKGGEGAGVSSPRHPGALSPLHHFVAVPLPVEAQLAPAFGVNVADFDGDGHEDVFLSQNFFATQPEMPRLDAGRGLLLRGGGSPAGEKGGKGAEEKSPFPPLPLSPFLLTPLSSRESGLEVYGEQRGAALGDFDRDGRVDLVVTQNGGVTRLFRNASARPGLRVRLAGPPGNPSGIGAILRPRFGERRGPAREVHGGSGYWSQDSAVQILGGSTPVTGIDVLWPGGQRTAIDLPAQAAEITIGLMGVVPSIPREPVAKP